MDSPGTGDQPKQTTVGLLLQPGLHQCLVAGLCEFSQCSKVRAMVGCRQLSQQPTAGGKSGHLSLLQEQGGEQFKAIDGLSWQAAIVHDQAQMLA